MLLDLDCTTQRPNINSFLKEDFSSLSDAVTPSLSGWIDVQNPPTFSFVQVKSCHRVLMERNVNEKYSINIPSIPFLPPQQPKPTTAATAAADTHSVSQSLHSVSTLAHNSSQRRWIACRTEMGKITCKMISINVTIVHFQLHWLLDIATITL